MTSKATRTDNNSKKKMNVNKLLEKKSTQSHKKKLKVVEVKSYNSNDEK